MNLLYLTEDYLYSKVHNNLLYNILEKDPSLTIYVVSPVRRENPHGLEDSFRHHERLIEIIPKVDIPIWRYKLDFWAKLKCKIRLIEKHVPIKEINVIHAATLYSEGATALKLHKKYGIPYLVSVRGADAMFYARKMPHLWLTGIKVMKSAGSLLCVTPAIKGKMLDCWQHYTVKGIIQNAYILNNGIDNVWLDNKHVESRPIGKPTRILYIGRFDTNKNVLRLIEAIKKVKEKYNVAITLVGGKGEEHDAVLKEVSENQGYMEYLGPIYDKLQLMEVVRRCDIFAMVSHSETFGLVYAECLTQGLPILYTKGTGFDDIYPQGFVGYGVDSYSVEDMKRAIEMIIENYIALRQNIENLDYSRYSWDSISKKYISIYNAIRL